MKIIKKLFNKIFKSKKNIPFLSNYILYINNRKSYMVLIDRNTN